MHRIKISISMMFVLKVYFNFATQTNNARRQMDSYWSSSSKIMMSLCVVRYHKVVENQRLDQFSILNYVNKHLIFNVLNTWLLGAVNKLSKITEVL